MTEVFWKEQMAHEPTRLYYEKLREVISSLKKTNWVLKTDILEIGLDVGISARAFLEFPNISLTSVDSGAVEGGIQHIKDWGFEDRWTFHPQRSDNFFAECKRTFDVIYIDGDHCYEQTKKDIMNAWGVLKEGGYLIGHDFLHKSNFREGNRYDKDSCGVTRAFQEFMCEKNVNATVYPPHPGLIVIQKP